MSEREMRTLIYKRTHEGDPDPQKGEFGNNGCMGTVRGWGFDAVIGVGGVGRDAQSHGIDAKITWIGIGPHKTGDDPRRPLVTFDHFLYYGKEGRPLNKVAPALAERMYGKNVRRLMDSLTPNERRDVKKLLDCAKDAPPSGQLEGAPERNSQKTSGKCRSNSCRGTWVGRKAEQENPANAKGRRG